MIKHRGKVVYDAIKSKGYSFNYVANKLEITRNSLYNYLKAEEMPYDIIIKISNIIHFDFRDSIPEIYEKSYQKDLAPYENKNEQQAKIVKIKYSNLVTHYNSLLKFLLDLANNYDLKDLKEEIKDHLKD